MLFWIEMALFVMFWMALALAIGIVLGHMVR